MNAGNGEEEPEEDRQAPLLGRRVDREVDPVRALAPGEAREPPADEIDERHEMGRIPDVRRKEAVQRIRKAPQHERRDPADEGDEDDGDRPQEDPHEVGDREEEPEENGEPRAHQVVVHHGSNRMLGKVRVRLGELRVRRRVARRQQEQVRAGLRPVAERIGSEITQSARRTSERRR